MNELATLTAALNSATSIASLPADMDERALMFVPDYTTALAANLNAAMTRNEAARAAYARIYGVEWAPLGWGAEIHDGGSVTSATVR